MNKTRMIMVGGAGAGSGAVRYDEAQSLSSSEQLQARQNIGLTDDSLKRQIVQTLPTENIDTNTIYMVARATAETQNAYDEYMYINNAWEKIGSTDVDLSDYYTKGQVDTAMTSKANTSDVYTKSEADAKFLTEHQELKTINNQSIVGEGNITIEGGVKTIITTNEYVEEESVWTNFRVHKDVLLPMLNSGEDFVIIAKYKNEYNTEMNIYHLKDTYIPNGGGYTEEQYLDFWVFTVNAADNSHKYLRYAGTPDDKGYYNAEVGTVSNEAKLNKDLVSWFGEDNKQGLFNDIVAIQDSFKTWNNYTKLYLIYHYVSESETRQLNICNISKNMEWDRPWEATEGQTGTWTMVCSCDDVNGKTLTYKITATYSKDEDKYENNYTIIEEPSIPTKTSQLTNDSDYTTKAYVDSLVGTINNELTTI